MFFHICCLFVKIEIFLWRGKLAQVMILSELKNRIFDGRQISVCSIYIYTPQTERQPILGRTQCIQLLRRYEI